MMKLPNCFFFDSIVFIKKNWIFDFHFFFFKKKGQRKVVTEFPLSALLEEQLSYVQNGRRQNGCCMLGFRLSIFYWWDSLLYLTHTHMGFFIYSTHIWPLASVETTMDGFLLFFIVGIQKDHKGSEPRQDSFRFYVRDASDNRSPPSQLDIVIEVTQQSH